jgi:RimJ/RimL family protein N-acetyltransferase
MKLPTPTLRSNRFILRELTRSDATALFPAFSDPELMRWWSRGPFEREEELADWLVPESGWSEGRSWAVAESNDGPAIARLAATDRGPGVVEVGYLVTRAHLRRRVAQETLTRLIKHIFETERQHRIYADTDPDNEASNRLLRSLGFKQEGRLRQQWTTHIGRRDSLIWGLLADEWNGRAEARLGLLSTQSRRSASERS